MLKIAAALVGGFFVFASQPAEAGARFVMQCFPPQAFPLAEGAKPLFSGIKDEEGLSLQIYGWPDGSWMALMIRPDGRRCPILGGSTHENDAEIVELEPEVKS